jgi:hypothetical protein
MKKEEKQKKETISQIRTIIENYGSFTTFDVDADSSPVIGTLGSAFMLAEHFELNGVDGYLYLNGDENERDIEFILYENLSMDCLEEILLLAQNYEAEEMKTEKRISN